MKNIVIACDSFKESMTALQACQAIERGIMKVNKENKIKIIPMADGGEGTCEILSYALDGQFIDVTVQGPLDQKVEADYYYDAQHKTAIIEVAKACGLHLIEIQNRNPLLTTTYGVGQIIKDALEKGAQKIYIGLGGSSTNDGGLGMLKALGAKFLDKDHKDISDVEKLMDLEKIDLDIPLELLKSCQIIVMSDVDNPFIGEKGATHVFAKQKGANRKQREVLEKCLTQYNDIVKSQYKIDLSKIKKTGAAGGLGGAFYLLGASLQSGIDTVLEVTQFEKHIQSADLIITGEGSIDSQTVNGKTISGILKIAQKHHVPVIAFAGRVTDNIEALYDLGLCSAFSITNEAKTLQKALNDGISSLENTSYNVFKVIDYYAE